jgi:hypothetical protein
MDHRKFLGGLINNTQQRFVWYKEQLQEVYKNRDLYPDWYKEYLREMRNYEEHMLKTLQEESMWLKQGIDFLGK